MTWAQTSAQRWVSDDVRGGDASSRRAPTGESTRRLAPAPSPNIERAHVKLRQRLDEILMFVDLEVDPNIVALEDLWSDRP